MQSHPTDFEHIKGRNSILADSLSRLKTLGLHEANVPNSQEVNMANLFLTQNQKSYVMLILAKILTRNLKIKV